MALEKGRELEQHELGRPDHLGRAPTRRASSRPHPVDLALLCYLQLPTPSAAPPCGPRPPRSGPGGTLLVIAHDARNLTDGTGGPQDPGVLYTAADVAGDLAGCGLEVETAGEVLRPVDGRRRPAIDALLRAAPGRLKREWSAASYSALMAASQAAGSRPSPGRSSRRSGRRPPCRRGTCRGWRCRPPSLNDAVGLRDLAVRPEVGQQRELVALALAEDLVRVRRSRR